MKIEENLLYIFYFFIDTCLYMSLFNFMFLSNLLVSMMFSARWFSIFGDFYWLYLNAVCMLVNQII